jgi:hypothetical protein
MPFYAPHGKVSSCSIPPLYSSSAFPPPFLLSIPPPLQGLANSARIGPDTGGGWTAVLQNLANALPVSLDAGPTANGGYWNDGSLQLTPGWGCKHEAVTSATPSDNCMTNTRFETMYSIWSAMAFNILLVGDFARLNPYVMATWTNDRVVAVNQDALGVPAVQVGGSGDRIVDNWRPAWEGPEGGPQMTVAECGGEPTQQQWVFESAGPTAGKLPRP